MGESCRQDQTACIGPSDLNDQSPSPWMVLLTRVYVGLPLVVKAVL